MENAVDALKIAFAAMVFTIALTLAISTFSQARETSEALLFVNDKTNYYNYDEVGEAEVVNPGTGVEYTKYEISKTDGTPNINYTDKRIVGIEAIIPTLYRYYKENYTVIFEGIDEDYSVYEATTKTEDGITKIDKWKKRSGTGENVFYFDLNSEIQANCPWVGTVNDIKKNLDLFLSGTTGYSFGNESRKVTYNGFIEEYANATFLEQLGEYATDRNYGIKTDADGNKWVVIGSDEYPYDSTTGRVEGQKISDFLEGKGVIINNATTKIDNESGEIIELAKPTIKRVIKYTKLP
ncbi:MAG: hypothetical protein IKT41_01395 [Clostridia bacterium]|nr:hypothetical protein [Clostridia bacterium]